ncbi:uncharacterized protein LOC127080866 [Lathyrus oleraceus]|uniref:uncharacterized protein LOC127080866 n=1 Tax=Pisum sativum TaxID=3888 RepID=UPI0021D3625D|nr:uncharacterized protein LOC127080866 [Pisum sativum]
MEDTFSWISVGSGFTGLARPFEKICSDIHVTVPSALKATFDSMLHISNTYIVTNFLSLPNDLMFKTSEHQFIIRFTTGTSVSDVSKYKIARKKLNIKPFVDIITGKWKKDLLIDVIGLVEEIGYTQLTSGSKKQQVNIILKDLGNNTLNCTLWESYVVKFMNYIQTKKDGGPTIMLLQIPKDYHVGSSSQLISTQSNMWSQNSFGSQLTSYDKFMSQATNLSLGDIVKLHDLIWCVTVATTYKPKASGNVWYYQACHKCPKVAKGSSPPYICVDNHSTETEILRCKIEIEVVDNSSNVIFVFWDRECTELLEISVAQLRQTMVEDDIHDPLEFPFVLDQLLGHEFAFKINEGVFEVALAEEWNVINVFLTTEKHKAPPITPLNSGKRGAHHGSSESLTLKEIVEGEQSSTRICRKHVKLEKK